MQVAGTIDAYRALRPGFAGPVGVVPTMGALHAGHRALVDRSLSDNATTVVTVFVNPTQFNDAADFARYPRDMEDDLDKLRDWGVECVFTPETGDMYPLDIRHLVVPPEDPDDLAHRFCGAHRAGHFTGVLTVVLKLLTVTAPDRAYFGEKDYQQYLLVDRMVRDFLLPVTIVPVPTVREGDGLALSSRNVLLSSGERALAPRLHAILTSAADAGQARERLAAEGFDVDYVEDDFGRRFAAAHLGVVRLIDNVPLSSPSPPIPGQRKDKQ